MMVVNEDNRQLNLAMVTYLLSGGEFITNKTELHCFVPTSWALIVEGTPKAFIAKEMSSSQ